MNISSKMSKKLIVSMIFSIFGLGIFVQASLPKKGQKGRPPIPTHPLSVTSKQVQIDADAKLAQQLYQESVQQDQIDADAKLAQQLAGMTFKNPEKGKGIAPKAQTAKDKDKKIAQEKEQFERDVAMARALQATFDTAQKSSLKPKIANIQIVEYKAATDLKAVESIILANADTLGDPKQKDPKVTLKRILEIIHDKNSATFVARDSNDARKPIIGFITSACKDNYLDVLAVDKNRRKNGCGTQLAKHMIKHFREIKKWKEIKLVTDKSNIAAVGLYTKKLGFKENCQLSDGGTEYILAGKALQAFI